MQIAIIKDDNEKVVGVVISTSLRHFKSRIESKLGFAIDDSDFEQLLRHDHITVYDQTRYGYPIHFTINCDIEEEI